MAAIALGLTLPATRADDLDDVEKKLTAAWKKHKSVTGNVASTMRMEQGPAVVSSQAEGTFEGLRKGEKYLHRMDLTNTVTQTVSGTEKKMEQKITMINDGQYVHSLIDASGTKLATKAKPGLQHAWDPALMFETMKEDYQLKLMPEESLDGEKVYVIEATPKKAGQLPLSKMVFYFQQEQGALAKTVAHGLAGEPLQTTTFTDLKFDVKIDPKRFVFEAPPGVQVIDQTGEGP
jgi:outer membrane lipoprotein-sorting protein